MRRSFSGSAVTPGLTTIEVFDGATTVAFQTTVLASSNNCLLPNSRNPQNECVLLPKSAPTGEVIPPVFTGTPFTYPISVGENDSRVGGIGQFFVVGAEITLSGVDADLFNISVDGTLSFNTPPDFENPLGGASGNSNTYTVTVTARGEGGETSEDVTVRVIDYEERPLPFSSSISAKTANSVTVDWVTPVSTDRPAITHYQIRYNIDGEAVVSTPNIDSTARSYTFTGLRSGTIYRFTVVATSPEGSRESATLSTTTPTLTTADITLSVTPSEVNESATPTDVTLTVTLVGGTFPQNRAIRFRSEGGTATAGTDYTVVPDTILNIPAGADSAITTIQFAALPDTVSELNGETVVITADFLTAGYLHNGELADNTFTVTPATITIINDPPPLAPVFANAAAFATAIEVEENQTAVGVADYFTASNIGSDSLVLSGADNDYFTLSPTGTLTFNNPPNFEQPRNIAPTQSNTNDYALTVTATNTTDTTTANFTVRVRDVNDKPAITVPDTTGFVEHTPKTITIEATDEDAGQTLTYALTGETLGATINLTTGEFTWTPREADGGEPRTFTVTVTDSGTTPAVGTLDFIITAGEAPNRSPTAALITTAGGVIALTNPATLVVSATATDLDNDDLIYTWSVLEGGGTFDPTTGASVTWTPPRVTTTSNVVLTVTVSDGVAGSTDVIDTQTVTVSPDSAKPVFTHRSTFSNIQVDEKVSAVGTTTSFVATTTGSNTITYTLGGADVGHFTLTPEGVLTFTSPPDFENPRGAPPTNTNTNTYQLTIEAAAGTLTTTESITVTVNNVNEVPVITAPVTTGFVEHTPKTITISAVDEDAGQTLTYALTGETFGATIIPATGEFTWTPREADGGEPRTFTVTATDSGTPPEVGTLDFIITATEADNRDPTAADITTQNGVTRITNPATLVVSATATDLDNDDLIYTWSVLEGGGTFDPATGASVTWTPPRVTADTQVTLTVTVSDGGGGTSATATETITVSTDPTIPIFENIASFSETFSVEEGNQAVGAEGHFAATGTGTISYTVSGLDNGFFDISSAGTLTFSSKPNYELPRNGPITSSNTNIYRINVVATINTKVTTEAITVTVTDINDAPVITAPDTTGFVEHTSKTISITATNEDAGQTVSYVLTGENHGATLTSTGDFSWTPDEDDGGVARTFTVVVTDDGSPVEIDTLSFIITAGETANRAPVVIISSTQDSVENPHSVTLSASVSDPDTGDAFTYAWTSSDAGVFDTANAVSTRFTPADVSATTPVTITLVVNDGTDDGTDTHELTVNPAPVQATAPVFTNPDTTFTAPENQRAVEAEGYFVATGTGSVTYGVSGVDGASFDISNTGTLTFASSPNFESPTDTGVDGTYNVTVTATASTLQTEKAITVTLTDVNEAHTITPPTIPTFREYVGGTFTISSTDLDSPAQTLTYTLTGDITGDAAITTAGVFTWTPTEADGGVARIFTVTATDSETPALTDSETFTITAAEEDNRPPSVTIEGVTSVSNFNTIQLTAAAVDPDTDDTLIYAWSVPVQSGTFDSATSASVVWNPPTVAVATPITITVTVTDGTLSVTDTHDVTVNPSPLIFDNDTFGNIQVEENVRAVAAESHFGATTTRSGNITLTLSGDNFGLFTLTNAGTLTFNNPPDYETPLGGASNNLNVYNLSISAYDGTQTIAQDFTVTVTNVNEPPSVTIATDTPTTITNPATFPTITATVTDPDAGETFTYAWTSADSSEIDTPTASGTFSSTTTKDTEWTPPTISGSDETITLTLTVTDGNNNIATATHNVIVSAKSATSITISSTPTTVTESATPTDITFTATLIGGTFPVNRTISIELINSGISRGTATLTTDYIVDSNTSLIILSGDETATVSIPFTAVADVLDEGNGETVVFNANLLTVAGNAVQPEFAAVTTTITINDPAAPTFTNADTFGPYPVVENIDAVGGSGHFAAVGSGTIEYSLTGTNAGLFRISPTGTLTFADAPDYETPLGSTAPHTNIYTVTVKAIDPSTGLSVTEDVVVTVSNINEAPVITPIADITDGFTEYSAGTITVQATDEDAGQTLTYALTGETYGATITQNGVFTWTPREVDGNVVRTFTLSVSDSNTPTAGTDIETFTITATELPNRPPTTAVITTAGGVTTITNPDTLVVSATATDLDDDPTLTYTWSSSVSTGTFTLQPVPAQLGHHLVYGLPPQ